VGSLLLTKVEKGGVVLDLLVYWVFNWLFADKNGCNSLADRSEVISSESVWSKPLGRFFPIQQACLPQAG
jgi:hypothetical protein